LFVAGGLSGGMMDVARGVVQQVDGVRVPAVLFENVVGSIVSRTTLISDRVSVASTCAGGVLPAASVVHCAAGAVLRSWC
jgi:hypothetical protein